MPICKVISIKNVGRFLNAPSAGDVAFRRYNLIFAENGRGKTTLCAILRSLQAGRPDYVIGRTTLGVSGSPEVQLLLDDGTATFKDGRWNRTMPELTVFDGLFISENVYSGDAVGTDHRRNLYRVIIGAQSVALAKRMEELDALIRDKNTEIRDARAEVQRHIPSEVTFDVFLGLPSEPAAEEKIHIKQQELQAAQAADELNRRTGLSTISLPELPSGMAETLSKTLEGVAADAQARVTEHIRKHRMEAHGEAWLTEGLGYVREDACPFCGRDIGASALVRAYRAYFSDAYHQLKRDAVALTGRISMTFREGEGDRIGRIIAENAAAVEFWRRYCTFESPVLERPESVGEATEALRRAALDLTRRKDAAPLEAIVPDETFSNANTAFEEAGAAVTAYNVVVAVANTAIAARKKEAGAARVGGIRSELARLQASKVRHTEDVRRVCDAYKKLQAEKTGLDQEKTKTRGQLDKQSSKLMAEYEQTINRYLDRFNTGFAIAQTTYDYRGGVPSSTYRILINQTPIDAGDAGTPLDRPSFKNTLSAGDRNTLALAFFLAQLERDPARASKVVVFDDPFTSQDSFRRSNTAQQIKRCGQTCAQVLVLSHDPNFLHLLWQRLQPAERKCLQLARVDEENTAVAEWDIEKAVQARYRADLDTLLKFHASNEGSPRDIAQKIRPVLEGYCRNLYPSQFADQDTLGIIVGKIKGTGAGHPLAAIVDDLEELNEYSRRYHHGENPNAAIEPIDDGELLGHVKRTLTLAGAL